jgi:hypothetical protein
MSNTKVIKLTDAAGGQDFTTVEAGAAVTMDHEPFFPRREAMAVVTGTFVGSIKIQGSDDNSTWSDLVDVSEPEYVQVTLQKYMRANCTAYTSGTIKARIAS